MTDDDYDDDPENIYTEEYIAELNFTEIYNSYIYENINYIVWDYFETENFEVTDIEWIAWNDAKISFSDWYNDYKWVVDLWWWNWEVLLEGFELEDYNEDYTKEGYSSHYEEHENETWFEEVVDVAERSVDNLWELTSMNLEERKEKVDELYFDLSNNYINEYNEIESTVNYYVENINEANILNERIEILNDIVYKLDNMNLSKEKQDFVNITMLTIKNSFEERINELEWTDKEESWESLDWILEDLLE